MRGADLQHTPRNPIREVRRAILRQRPAHAVNEKIIFDYRVTNAIRIPRSVDQQRVRRSNDRTVSIRADDDVAFDRGVIDVHYLDASKRSAVCDRLSGLPVGNAIIVRVYIDASRRHQHAIDNKPHYSDALLRIAIRPSRASEIERVNRIILGVVIRTVQISGTFDPRSPSRFADKGNTA
ncbi:hypothetical protein D3C87_1334940 [compost metagenome]